MPTKPVPDDYGAVTSMLIVDGAAQLIEFMEKAFGAAQRLRMPMPDGKVAHAELTIGGEVVMVADATPEYPPLAAGIHLYVENVDSVYAQAIAAGATKVMAPTDQFYGDRSATVRDGFGNLWSIATHTEDVSEAEMMRRMAAMGRS